MSEDLREEEVQDKSDGPATAGEIAVDVDDPQWASQLDDFREELEDLNRRAVEFVRENPAVCMLGALGIGYLVGKMASRRWLV